MFKKALKIAVTFSLLVGAYAGYTRLFALIVARYGADRLAQEEFLPDFESNWGKKAAELARESFGPDHFASRDDLKLQYYEGARGFFMYAQDKEILNEGKRLKVKPFAMIWVAKDGKSRKIATSDEAIIDFSQPIMSASSARGPSKVLHATMIGDVKLRDDKGTRPDPTDDLFIGPLSQVDFDDEKLQITSESDVFLRDRDLTLTGIGLMIQLRRKLVAPDPYGHPVPGEASGYDAETAFVWRDIHVVVNDATRDGVLPGTAKPEKSGKTPIDVRSDREMRVDLPKPRSLDIVGPPNFDRPPDPTFVKFRTNVVVIRGTDKADQLNCDTLHLTLMPDPKKPGAGEILQAKPGTEPSKEEGPLNELKIRKALAQGDAVWLQSEAQGMVARCVELKYEKHAFEGLPDVTYLNGGVGKKLMIEKVDYDLKAETPNTIKSVMRMSALDATIFESGGPGGATKIIARGPGNVKERPSRNASIRREVWFEDEMEMLTWHDGQDVPPRPSPLAVRSLSQARPAIQPGTLRRVLTLSGVSKLVDVDTSTTLDARKAIVAEFQGEAACDLRLLSSFKAGEELPAKGKNQVVVAVDDGRLRFRIFDRDGQHWLDWDEDARSPKAAGIDEIKKKLAALKPDQPLNAGDRARIIDAVASIVEPAAGALLPVTRKDGPDQIQWLDAFEDAHLTAPSKVLTARQFLYAKFEQAPPPARPAPPVALAAALPVPGTGAVAPAPPVVVAAVAKPTAVEPGAKPELETKPIKPEPLVDGRADRVWACVLMGANPGDAAGKSKGELKDAQLRGGVMVHQDPAPGKLYGSDASGEALDLTNQGDGLMKFVVKREEPQAYDPKTRLASSKGRSTTSTIALARVEFEGKTIDSEDLIWVDQKADMAHCQGAGLFTQMADRGLLDDKGIEGEKPRIEADGKAVKLTKPAGPNPKDRLAITWNREMRFYGKSVDLEGRPAAKIEFRGESLVVRTQDGRREFRRGVEAKMTESAIFGDTMDVYMDRVVKFNKTDKKPANPDEPKEPEPQIAMLDCKGQDIVEDYAIVVPGVVIISVKFLTEAHKGELKEKQRIEGTHVIYDKRTGNFHSYGPGMAWLYHRKSEGAQDDGLIPTTSLISSTPSNGSRPRPEVALKDRELPPLELTKIRYSIGMDGRFGVSRDKDEKERRDAEFRGDVEAADATVQTGNSDLDFDQLSKHADSVFLTSQVLNVYSIPLPAGSKSANKQLLDAKINAQARTPRDTIQADRITYNSATALTHAYGFDGKEVSITKQDSPGQAPSPSRGTMVLYNNKTRQSKINDPHALAFVDLKSGIRAKAFAPDLGGSFKAPAPKPLPRVPLQRQGKVSTERYGFTGH